MTDDVILNRLKFDVVSDSRRDLLYSPENSNLILVHDVFLTATLICEMDAAVLLV